MTGPISDTARARFLERLLTTTPGADERPAEEPSRLAGLAEQLSADRRARERAFGADADLFGEPAWDLLLRLYAAHYRGEPTEPGLSGAPAGREERWIDRLEARGLVERVGPGSGAPSLRVTPRAFHLISDYLTGLLNR